MDNSLGDDAGFYRGVWLSQLRRLNAAEAPASAAFDRRRRRVLLLGAGATLLSSIPWLLFFVYIDHPTAALGEAAVALAAVGVLQLTRLRLMRLASLVFSLSSLLALWGLTLATDVPTPSMPRSLHLLMIPLFVGSFFLLQQDRRHWRWSLPMLTLASFAVLSGHTGGFGFRPVLPDEMRTPAIWWVTVFTVGMLYALLSAILGESKENSALESDLLRALGSGEIQVHLQAQCDVAGRIVGAEALMRWQHPQRGFVSPAEFIPVAERSGLIVPAGEMVARQVCALLLRWRHEPALAGMTVSINVSPGQIRDARAMQRLLDIVTEPGLPHGAIKFELTESVFVEDFRGVRERMAECRSRGIRMALDDFGTGFSSLSYLKLLPLDQLKIDQSFVRGLPGDAGAVAITRTIIGLSRELGLETVAEGVETAAQAEALLQLGCSTHQGFFYARPLPVPEFEALVRAPLKRAAAGSSPALQPAEPVQ